MATATIASTTPSPKVISRAPVMSETKFAKAATHNRDTFLGVPLRSFGGICSMPRASTRRNASAGASCN
jgi:hypothetical protein